MHNKNIMKYISLIKLINEDWKIGFNISNDLYQHEKFRDELIETNSVEDVKIFELNEVTKKKE